MLELIRYLVSFVMRNMTFRDCIHRLLLFLNMLGLCVQGNDNDQQRTSRFDMFYMCGVYAAFVFGDILDTHYCW